MRQPVGLLVDLAVSPCLAIEHQCHRLWALPRLLLEQADQGLLARVILARVIPSA